MLSSGSLFFSLSLLCSLDNRMLFNSSCSFRIHSLSPLTLFNYALNSLTVCCKSDRLSFIFSLIFSKILPSLRLPSSLFTVFLGWDSYSTNIDTFAIISYKNQVILLVMFVRDSNHNRINSVFWFYQYQCWACLGQVL